MAKQVAELAPRKGRPQTYKWDQYLDGTAWELTRGEDYTSQSRSFLSQARKAAADRGMKLVTRTIESGPVREDPTNPKSKFVRDGDGEKLIDATVVQVQAFPADDDTDDGDDVAADDE